ncbi:MAG: FCSD flavin-binding domain-containing protein [Hydrogenophilus sp.]|nr:FCSD flavin-binding domain-containing protein [Hydrogenophilus sp.]
MVQIHRRTFLQGVGVTAAVGVLGAPSLALGAAKKVVIVGGGTGGATAAQYLRRYDPTIEVTLIDTSKEYYTCYFSNLVIAGLRDLKSIRQTHEGLSKRGVKIVHDMVTAIDGGAKQVVTASGQKFPFDRCIVAPGIDLVYGAVEGYTAELEEKIPHAWKAGSQTDLLAKQIKEMKPGGVVVMIAPPNPYRCPPGPYERACMIAHYLKQNKPGSKVVIIDPKDKFSKQGLFTAAWKKHYDGIVEWLGSDKVGTKFAIDPTTLTVKTQAGEIKADVLNVIPPQRAGKVAQASNLVDDKGWCPVNPATFESTLVPGVHVIGDAAIAGAMPKSGYAANSQGKVCAMAVALLLNGKQPVQPAYTNTCYSFITPDQAVSVAAIYELKEGKIVEKVGGLTPADASDEVLRREGQYAESWYRNIVVDCFG